MIQRRIFVRCEECGSRWSEAIPSIQPAGQRLQISAIVCHCGAGYQRINLSIPTQES